jgi:hypothetical protein
MSLEARLEQNEHNSVVNSVVERIKRTAAAVTVGAILLTGCGTPEEQGLTSPSTELESPDTNPSPVDDTDTVSPMNSDVSSSTPNESESSLVDDDSSSDNIVDSPESGVDTSYWNLSPDKIEILSFFATEHGYPVSAEKGDFTEGASYDEILFEASLAFMASRNTHSLLPLANYFGYETVDEWASNTSDSVYGIADSFDDMFFYKPVTDSETEFNAFDRSYGQVFIEELYLPNGNRRVSSVDDTALKSYAFQMPFGYEGGGLEDPSLAYDLDKSNWSNEEFISNSLGSYGLVLEIADDGDRIAEFTVTYI